MSKPQKLTRRERSLVAAAKSKERVETCHFWREKFGAEEANRLLSGQYPFPMPDKKVPIIVARVQAVIADRAALKCELAGLRLSAAEALRAAGVEQWDSVPHGIAQVAAERDACHSVMRLAASTLGEAGIPCEPGVVSSKIGELARDRDEQRKRAEVSATSEGDAWAALNGLEADYHKERDRSRQLEAEVTALRTALVRQGKIISAFRCLWSEACGIIFDAERAAGMDGQETASAELPLVVSKLARAAKTPEGTKP